MKTLMFLILSSMVSGFAFASDAGFQRCSTSLGQISFSFNSDLTSITVSQARYALKYGPVTDMAHQLGLLSGERAALGVETFVATTSDNGGTLVFTFTNGSQQIVTSKDLSVRESTQLSNGKLSRVVTLISGTQQLLSLFAEPSECATN